MYGILTILAASVGHRRTVPAISIVLYTGTTAGTAGTVNGEHIILPDIQQTASWRTMSACGGCGCVPARTSHHRGLMFFSLVGGAAEAAAAVQCTGKPQTSVHAHEAVVG